MQRSLVALEADPSDSHHIDEFFRDAHSLKGMAAAMGFTPIRDLSHACEDLMDAVRSGRLTFSTDEADALLAATEALSAMLSEVESDGSPQGGGDVRRITARLRAAIPDTDDEEASAPRIDIPDLPDVGPPPEPPAAREATPAEPSAPEPTPRPRPQPKARPQPEPAKARRSPAPGQRAVKVSTDLLDRLIDGLGEIMAVRQLLSSEVRKQRNPLLFEALMRLDRAAGTLRDDVVASRLAPLASVLDRLPIVARNVARARDKRVETHIEGGQIEIDRSILAALDQPLMHIIRNGVDHGLETPAERSAAAKPERGQLHIRVRREKDLVVVDVSDDGRGMDPDVIGERAVERGLVSRERLETMTPTRKLELVCTPGFSTADQVTDVSGRGVGMDVVRTTVERFGGSLLLHSAVGEGTTVSLRLPRILALMDVILVMAGSETFALPLSRIERTIDVSADQVQAAGEGYEVTVGEEKLPVRSLAAMVQLQSNWEGDRLRAVIVEASSGPTAFRVDEIQGLREVVIKPLAPPLVGIEGLAGVTLADEGRPVFVVDPLKLL